MIISYIDTAWVIKSGGALNDIINYNSSLHLYMSISQKHVFHKSERVSQMH